MNIKLLRQQKADALAKAKAIYAAAEKDSRNLTDSERAEYDATMSSVDVMNADIARAERLLDQERTAPAARVEVTSNEATKPWETFGQQLMAVRDAAVTHGRNTDPRLFAALGTNESVDAEGGFLVQPDFATGILQRTYDTGLLSSRTFDMPMNSNRLIMNGVDEDSRADGSRWGGIQAYWESEASTYTASKPKFRQMQLTANKLLGLCYVTEELLDDATALQSYISSAFPDEFAFKIDDAIMNGPGSGTPLGLMTSNTPVVVAKDSGQAAKTISTTNVLNMWARLYGRSRRTAAWFINQDVEPQLYPLTLGSGTAVSLLYTAPGTGANNTDYGLLMGRPVIPIEQAASLGTQGDIVAADLTQYLLARKAGIRADSSIHVAFLTGEQAFRFMLRLDGQPMWKKPLTPKNGTNTLSPFVTLAAR